MPVAHSERKKVPRAGFLFDPIENHPTDVDAHDFDTRFPYFYPRFNGSGLPSEQNQDHDRDTALFVGQQLFYDDTSQVPDSFSQNQACVSSSPVLQ